MPPSLPLLNTPLFALLPLACLRYKISPNVSSIRLFPHSTLFAHHAFYPLQQQTTDSFLSRSVLVLISFFRFRSVYSCLPRSFRLPAFPPVSSAAESLADGSATSATAATYRPTARCRDGEWHSHVQSGRICRCPGAAEAASLRLGPSGNCGCRRHGATTGLGRCRDSAAGTSNTIIPFAAAHTARAGRAPTRVSEPGSEW